MIIFVLLVVGASMGSFVNALTWRIYQQSKKDKTKTTINGKKVDLSMTTGRSVCVHCGHELVAKDLVPVLSWVSLRGKCRYCKKPIEDSPLVEVLSAGLFVASYLAWPYTLSQAGEWAAFVLWLVMLVGLVALVVYDLRHLLLPNRIVFPLMSIALAMRIALALSLDTEIVDTLRDIGLGVMVGGGFFYLLFQISQGKWIGGGDVKLGFLIGLSLGPADALVALLSAFYIAAFVVVPLMLAKKIGRKSQIPFGPFLIAGFIIAMLWGTDVRDLYKSIFGL